jgi:hypothetical protein
VLSCDVTQAPLTAQTQQVPEATPRRLAPRRPNAQAGLSDPKTFARLVRLDL